MIEQRDKATRAIASSLQPDYLFHGTNQLPATINEMWPGPWQWIIYSVNDPTEAARHANAGFTLIETDDIGAMLDKV